MHVQPDTLATARSHPRASVYAEHVHQGRQWAGRSGSLAREALQPESDATISFGLPIEPEDSQYGESWLTEML